MDIDEAIEKRVGEVRTDALDLTYGELMSLYSSEEFVISPDFQRLFRWSPAQQSRLVESILLELPIPQIVVIETQAGVLELIDGLQRVSSVIHFIQPALIEKPVALTLSGCELIPELNGKRFEDFPLPLRLRIKRSTIRAVVIKRQSSKMLRYEMFNRLNTGGEELSEQERRNCTSRMVGEEGALFYDFIAARAKVDSFAHCTSSLPDTIRDKRGDEELVLRFLALKNAADEFKGSLVDWLDEYMRKVIFQEISFNYEQEGRDFDRLFGYLDFVLGEGAFVRYRGQTQIGGLSPAYFEAITMGTWRVLDRLQQVPPENVRQKIVQTVQTERFRDSVGSASNARQKFTARMDIIAQSLGELVP